MRVRVCVCISVYLYGYVCNLCRCKYARYKILLILLYIRIPPSVTMRYSVVPLLIVNYTHMLYEPHAGLA